MIRISINAMSNAKTINLLWCGNIAYTVAEFPYDGKLTLGAIKAKCSFLLHNEMRSKKLYFIKFIPLKGGAYNAKDPYWPDSTTLADYAAYYAPYHKSTRCEIIYSIL
jgi:hypothetical protein